MKAAEPDFPLFTSMINQALDGWVTETATFLGMMAENIEIEHPYAPDGLRRMTGKAEVVEHFRNILNLFTIDHAEAQQVYRCEGRKTVIVEFDMAGRWLDSGKAYRQQCVGIIETDSGQIVRYREYWNPLAPGMPGGPDV
jgi:ketosteroid isomerase-like protein